MGLIVSAASSATASVAPAVGAPTTSQLRPYVPRVVLAQLAAGDAPRSRTVEGTVVFVDVSGFTKLSERLARRGREGAEHLADAIGGCFASVLGLAYANGGSLLKFGGDALLLLFDGPDHVERAVRSAAGMRRMLREVGRIGVGGAKVTLRMSVGVHTGDFHVFLVGASHREFLVTGPAASRVVHMESAAGAGEIVLSDEVCDRLPGGCVGERKGPGRLLVRAPRGAALPPDVPDWAIDEDVVAGCLSTVLRSHVVAGVQPPEHRTVTVGFVHFDGTDALIEREGLAAATDTLDRLVSGVQAAADEYGVCFLASDVDADGGKLILTAGAPRVLEDDEERMLLALRRIIESDPPLPVHIGVNRGPVFAGDIGPHFRRTYTVMGDAVNLAARLMAKAPAGELYASAGVLDRSGTSFERRELEPFMVKGKAKPVQAWSVGRVVSGRRAETVAERAPLVGREAERELLLRTLEMALRGSGRVVELVGEPGIGKTRLLEEVVAHAGSARVVRAVCEPYTASTPYATAGELLRQIIEVGREDPDELVLARLHDAARSQDPGLAAWLPLLALVLDVPAPGTPEVDQLAPEFRPQALTRTFLRFLEPHLANPTVVAVEDAQHMDVASRSLLDALAERLGTTSWLLTLTRREPDEASSAPENSELVRIELPALSGDETLELAEALTRSKPIPPGLVHVAVRRSCGNPQFLRDLLDALAQGVDELPENIEAAAMARIDRLSPADRELVRRLSVLGVEFDARLLEHVLDGATARLDEATWQRLRDLVDRADDGRIRFRRPLVREAAYEGLPFKTRRRLHALAGERLERELGGDADEAAEMLSLHFLSAGDFDRAYRYARSAADRAAGRFAYADALASYRRAVDAAARLQRPAGELAEVWESLGVARARIGQPRAAVEAFTVARRLVAPDGLREAQLLYRQALVQIDAHGVGAAVRAISKGLRALTDRADDNGETARCEALLVAALARVRARQGRLEEAARVSRRAMALAEVAGERAALARACYVLDWALIESGRTREAKHAWRALEIYREIGDRYQEASVLNSLGGYAYRDGRWDDAVTLWQQGSDAYAACGSLMDVAFGVGNIGELRSDQGRLQEAEPLIVRSRQLFQGAGHEWGVAYTTALLGRLAVRASRHDHARPLFEEALSRFAELRAEQEAAWAEALLSEAHAAAGRPAEALSVAERLLRHGKLGRLAPLLHRARGLALTHLGELEAAQPALRASLVAAREQEEDFEVALTLNALDAVAPADSRTLQEWRAERDAIAQRLDIVRFPPLPTRPR